MAEHQIPYGLHGDTCLHISELPKSRNGLKCECVCPSCGGQLVARMGDKRRHYFAHYQFSACTGAAETGLHLRAKSILQASKMLCLPAEQIVVTRTYYQHQVSASADLVKGGTVVTFDAVEVEQPENGFQPDVTGYSKGRKLFIEIRVTHAVDIEKQLKIEASGTSCIEVNLSGLDRFATPADIEAAINSTHLSSWLFHAQKKRKTQRLYDSLEAEYHALIARYKDDVAREQAALDRAAKKALRTERFKDALRDVGQRLTQRLLSYNIIPQHLANDSSHHQYFSGYDDNRYIAVIELYLPAKNTREAISIVWNYKGAYRDIHRRVRRTGMPYCTIDIAELVTHHKPPHHPIQEHELDAFIAQWVLPVIHEPSKWLIVPPWFEEQERQRLELQKRQEATRKASQQRRLETEAKERHRQHMLQLTERLRADIAAMEQLALKCQHRANDIDTVRDRTDLPITSRWSIVSESGILAVERLEHVTAECFDNVLKPLCFPYPHEWAYSQHPDLVKALVVDRIVGLQHSISSVTARHIESIYMTVLDQLDQRAERPSAMSHWGASTLAQEVREMVDHVKAQWWHYQTFAAHDTAIKEGVGKLQEGLRAFEEPNDRPIYPATDSIKRLFVQLLCQDLTRVGMLVQEGESYRLRFKLHDKA